MYSLGASDLEEPLRLLQGVRPYVIVYGCISVTMTHGYEVDRSLAEAIRSNSGAKTVTAADPLVHVLQTLGAKRIGFASPYVPAINDLAISFLADAGCETVVRSEVDAVLDNQGQGAMDPQAVYDLGRAADAATAEVIVLSCTDTRSLEIISRLEQTVGKPVISSN